MIEHDSYIHPHKALPFVKRFFYDIGIEDAYFRDTKGELISSHIQTIYAEKILQSCSRDKEKHSNVYIHQDYGEHALYCTRTLNTNSEGRANCVPLERVIEARYLLEGYGQEYEKAKSKMKEQPYRLQVFTTQNNFDEEVFTFPFRFYVLKKTKMVTKS